MLLQQKILSSESTLLIFFENITVFHLLLLASELEKVFVWMVSLNKPAILLIASP